MPLLCSWDWLVNTSQWVQMPIYPSDWIATVVSVLAEWANAPLADGLFKISANAPVPGKLPTHSPFEARCSLLSFHFYTFRYLWLNWVIVPTWLQLCTTYVQHRASANICRPNIECLLWFSEGRDDLKVIHLFWVGLLLICTICPHTTLLGFLPASWLGCTVSWGVCTAGNLHITQIIIWCSKRVSFLFIQGGTVLFIYSFGIVCSCYDTLSFSHTCSSENRNHTFVSRLS